MPSKFGENIKVSIFGRSHEQYVGVTVEGLPAGEVIDLNKLYEFMRRRSPGKEGTSQRQEKDIPVIQSGITDGLTDGKPLTAIIYNEDVKSEDYKELACIPRPGHADYGAYIKFGGKEDMRGGGKFSGRMTAPLCAAGGIALQILSSRGIEIHAKLETDYEPQDGDSVGGIVLCEIFGLPVGLGDALFDGLDGKIASAVFAIPAVKGIEFGAGFKAAAMSGSENNDEYIISDGKVTCSSNNAGGILGGMSNGMPVVFRTAFKPTPSISKEQRSVNLCTMEETTIKVKGRHDPCVAIRAVPVVEAAAAIAVLDCMPGSDRSNIRNKIDIIDREIAVLLKERFALTDDIGRYKKKNNLKVKDISREYEVIDNVASAAGDGLETEISKIYADIFDLSVKRQEKV